jgi:type I restriction-modification system DNA methylase subunit
LFLHRPKSENHAIKKQNQPHFLGLSLKKCRKSDDVLFINASEHFTKDKRQNRLDKTHIDKIVDTYQYRIEEIFCVCPSPLHHETRRHVVG